MTEYRPLPTGSVADVARNVERVTANIELVIQGKPEVIHNAVVCLLAEGHLLIEDVPGTGKTSLARALAASLAVSWHRIQFTPDLLPSDVTGVSVYNQATNEFSFKPGPIFANIVLGDEINRASPKTQSALLEVMEEGTLSYDGEVYAMPRPFMVVATQNPIDMEGTYLLPEAQLDRFLMRLSVGYPSLEAEAAVLRTQKLGPSVDNLVPVLSAQQVAEMISTVRRVEVSAALEDYIVAISAATRTMPELRLGVSPRGSLALLRAARARAAAVGREFVLPDDVKEMAPVVLGHRVILQPDAELKGHTGLELITRALHAVPVPRSAPVNADR
jgi:MoxR-like ATPase